MKNRHFLSQLFLNLCNRERKCDYAILASIGTFPLLLAYYFGLAGDYTVDGVTYVGYMNHLNWWPMAFIMPLALWVVRWTFARIAPLSAETLPTPPPGIIQLLRTPQAKEAVYQKMRDWMSSAKVMGTVLFVSFAIQVADLSELASVYLFESAVSAGEYDWSIMYQIDIVSKQTNFIFNVIAYMTQFSITIIAVFGVSFLLSHNLFFLSRIYQRRLIPPGEDDNYISIDLEDVNKCFGFREANNAFNTQIFGIVLAGFFVLISRFSTMVSEQNIVMEDFLQWPMNIEVTSFYPKISQVLLAFGWFSALIIISLPALVKLLPRLPLGGIPPDLNISNYLHEFIPDSLWRYGKNPSANEVEYLSARFADNAFWPTGNNRASQLFFLCAWVFLIVLFPFKTADMKLIIISYGTLGLFAYGMRTSLFVLLNSSLSYVDERLSYVSPDKLINAPQKQIHRKTRIFISYRREDSAAYSRLIRQSLLEHMDESQVFMDVVGIQDGEDFVDAINDAVLGCDVLIAMIGKGWVDCRDKNGNRRLEQENDFVRLEIASALSENRLVIPALVGGSTMPEADDLPENLKPLTRRQAREFSDTRWDYDISQLVKTLGDIK